MKEFMNKVIIFIAIFLIVFTAINLFIFYRIGNSPDVLITAVFSACLGELGFMSWIKNTKQKYIDTEPTYTDDDDDDEEE